MFLPTAFAIILAFYCCLSGTSAQNVNADCDTLHARCRICVRSIHEGPDEDNILGRLNRHCQMQVGRIYAWRNLGRCDMNFIRCRGLEENFSCAAMAVLAGMPRRLQ